MVDSGSIVDTPVEDGAPEGSGDSIVDSGSIVDSDSIIDSGSSVDSPEPTDATEPLETPSGTVVAGDAGKPEDTPLPILDTLPNLSTGKGDKQERFVKDATKAIRRSYEEDYSDPAILLSLNEKLRADDGLKGLRSEWGTPLAEAVERTRGLQKVTFSIRRLKAAFEKARWDAQMTVFRDIDIQTCRVAFKQINEAGADLMQLVVTIKPVGRHSLTRFETICNDSHGASLMERDFPRVKGPPRLRRLVKKLFQREYTGARVHKVTIEQTWALSAEGDTKVLTAIVGVERKNAFPEDPCVMQKVLLKRTKSGRRWAKPSCCDIEETTAIACGVIK